MAKIIHFPKRGEYDNITAFLEESIEVLEGEGIECLLIAGKNEDGSIVTGYHNCDPGTMQELCGHIQCDIINQMIQVNFDTYFEDE